MEDKARQILAEVLRISPTRVNRDTSPDNTPEWDSLKHVTLVMAVEEDFGITLEVEEIEAIGSFGDLLDLLGRKA